MEFNLVMPRLGSEMVHGNIVQWLKKEGDQVNKGDLLFTVDTEKAVMDVESEVSGTLRKILINDPEKQVPVGDVIAIIETKD
jgi:pyruvate dehydrogenase E2 component (dihydrolipoamide acetyltransferase)